MRKLVFFLAFTAAAQNWPSFRGPEASGVADSQHLPVKWDAAKGTGILWSTPVPGLAHSSPIVWGDRIFVTTAVSSKPNATFKRGLYGEGDASDDVSVQRWRSSASTAIRASCCGSKRHTKGAPKEKRHMKATYANSTPVTDGRVVVAYFGSQGIYAYDLEGKPLWKRDLGRINVGAYDLKDYEWGTASSPILYKDLVIVQCDQQQGSFLVALDRASGKTVWKTERDELPSWGTPAIFAGKQRTELVTNGSNFIRGYDPTTGKELWRLGGSSKITAPTPVSSGDIVLVSSGRRPEAPIFAIRPGAEWRAGGRLAEAAARPLHADAADLRRVSVHPGQRRHLRLLCFQDGRGSVPAADSAPGFGLQRIARGLGRQDLPAERGWRHLRGEGRRAVRVAGEERNGRAVDGHAGDRGGQADRAHRASFVGHRES